MIRTIRILSTRDETRCDTCGHTLRVGDTARRTVGGRYTSCSDYCARATQRQFRAWLRGHTKRATS